MKKAKVLAALLLVALLLVAVPATAMAAGWGPVYNETEMHYLRVEGPDVVVPGTTGEFNMWFGYLSDSSEEGLEEKNGSIESPRYVSWTIVSNVAPGTSITPDGVGILTVDPTETASIIRIYAEDAACKFGMYINVHTAPQAGSGTESDFWYGVHERLGELPDGGRLEVETTNEDGHIPYFIFQCMLDTNLTLTVHRGLDTFVLTSAFVEKLNPYAYSLSFTQSLTQMLAPTANDRGGFTYQ